MFLYSSIICSSVPSDNCCGPSMHIRIACSKVSSPNLLLNLVLINFMLLNERSMVAVVTGNTSSISANFDKVGNPALMSSFLVSVKRTYCKDFSRYCF